ncbi:hypothetical protein ACWIWK_00645 [Helicobacter sp. 23-1048]
MPKKQSKSTTTQKSPSKSIDKPALSTTKQQGIKTKFSPNDIKDKQGDYVILNDVFRTFAVQASFVQYCGRRDISLKTKIKPRNAKQIQHYTQSEDYNSNVSSVTMKIKDLLEVIKQIKEFERTTHLKPKKLQVIFMQRLNEWERLQNKIAKQDS